MQTSTPQWEPSTVLTTTVFCAHRCRANPVDASDAWLVSVLFYFKDINALFLSHERCFLFCKRTEALRFLFEV